MKKVVYIVLDMEKKNESPIISIYEKLDDAINDAIHYAQFLENRNNIWIEHWEDGLSVRLLKINEETGEYESHFDDSYVPDVDEEDLDLEAIYKD